MKKFLKTMLAAALGCLIVTGLAIYIVFAIISAMLDFSKEEPTMPGKAVLVVDMADFAIGEQTVEDDFFSSLQQDSKPVLGLLDAVCAINEAASDPKVEFILLKADEVSGGMADLEELRYALEGFRQSGKPVIAWTEMPTNGSYYLSSVADRVVVSSYKGGANMLTGLQAQITFLKDILDKLGVNVQLIRHGKYKSAGEMFIRSSISDENRTQYEELLGSIWAVWTSQIESSRQLVPGYFNKLIDGLYLNTPEDFVAFNLADEMMTKEEFNDKLCAIYGGVSSIDKVKTISISDYATIKVNNVRSGKPIIAVVYADGDIIDGYETEDVAGDRFAKILSDLRKNDKVKAVVLRVNSPGGSVVGSDKIKTEIDLLRATKPVIASYGNYAASGGYWISNSCDAIFSNASTLTGSIGVFSMIPDFSQTCKKIGVNMTSITTNAHGDMYGGMRALNKEELAYMQNSVDNIYETFVSIVADGRGLSKEDVDEMAQGRVWSGVNALDKKLVDNIGGLEQAIVYATVQAGTPYADHNWSIECYPKPITLEDKIMMVINGETEVKLFTGTPFEKIEEIFGSWKAEDAGKLYARLPYALTIE